MIEKIKKLFRKIKRLLSITTGLRGQAYLLDENGDEISFNITDSGIPDSYFDPGKVDGLTDEPVEMTIDFGGVLSTVDVDRIGFKPEEESDEPKD